MWLSGIPTDEQIRQGHAGCTILSNYEINRNTDYGIYSYPFNALSNVDYISIYFESYIGKPINIYIFRVDLLNHVNLLQEMPIDKPDGGYFFGLNTFEDDDMKIIVKVFYPYEVIDFKVKVCGYSGSPTDEQIRQGHKGCTPLNDPEMDKYTDYDTYSYPFSTLSNVDYIALYFESYIGKPISIYIDSDKASLAVGIFC